jgi:hypothetical protein
MPSRWFQRVVVELLNLAAWLGAMALLALLGVADFWSFVVFFVGVTLTSAMLGDRSVLGHIEQTAKTNRRLEAPLRPRRDRP